MGLVNTLCMILILSILAGCQRGKSEKEAYKTPSEAIQNVDYKLKGLVACKSVTSERSAGLELKAYYVSIDCPTDRNKIGTSSEEIKQLAKVVKLAIATKELSLNQKNYIEAVEKAIHSIQEILTEEERTYRQYDEYIAYQESTAQKLNSEIQSEIRNLKNLGCNLTEDKTKPFNCTEFKNGTEYSDRIYSMRNLGEKCKEIAKLNSTLDQTTQSRNAFLSQLSDNKAIASTLKDTIYPIVQKLNKIDSELKAELLEAGVNTQLDFSLTDFYNENSYYDYWRLERKTELLRQIVKTLKTKAFESKDVLLIDVIKLKKEPSIYNTYYSSPVFNEKVKGWPLTLVIDQDALSSNGKLKVEDQLGSFLESLNLKEAKTAIAQIISLKLKFTCKSSREAEDNYYYSAKSCSTAAMNVLKLAKDFDLSEYSISVYDHIKKPNVKKTTYGLFMEFGTNSKYPEDSQALYEMLLQNAAK